MDKGYKIITDNETTYCNDVVVQNKFLEMGYSWRSGGTNILRKRNIFCLYIDCENKSLTHGYYIADKTKYFINHEYKEIKLLQPAQLKFLDTIKNQPTFFWINYITEQGFYLVEQAKMLNKILNNKPWI